MLSGDALWISKIPRLTIKRENILGLGKISAMEAVSKFLLKLWHVQPLALSIISLCYSCGLMPEVFRPLPAIKDVVYSILPTND